MLIKRLRERYDGVQLILVIGDTLKPDYEKSIIDIAMHFKIPYVNLVGKDIPKCKSCHPNIPA